MTPRFQRSRSRSIAHLALASFALASISACHHATPPGSAHRSVRLPPIVLWAWQEPEDLRSAEPRRLAVAVLAETLFLSDHLTAEPRHQPLLLAPGTRVLPVVRIQAVRGFQDTPGLRSALARHLADLAAQHPDAAALQLDFDAVTSQHPFYAAVLRDLRAQLPPALPLTITALVSWCGQPSWLNALAIDSAIPMFFRMGGPDIHTPNAPNPLHPGVHAQPPTPLPNLAPPCRGSLGLSTDEPWPQISPGTTVYLFSPTPWTSNQLHLLNTLDPARLTR